MAINRKRKAGPRKNPKRVAAGRKAAAARWGKKKSRKVSKKAPKRKRNLESMIDSVLSKKYAISIDGSLHKVAFPGHRSKKVAKKKGRKGGRSAANLANLARGRAIRAANLAAGKQYGPVYKPQMAGKGPIAAIGEFFGPVHRPGYAQKVEQLKKARAVRAANIVARKAGIGSWN